MARSSVDPTQPIRLRASRYAEVDEGTSCTQSSFKVGGKAFLFVGEQGGRSKMMVKLKTSMPQAKKLASEDPDSYQVGSTGWVTARFTAADPLPKKLWEKWLDESYELSRGTSTRKTASAKKKRRTSKKS